MRYFALLLLVATGPIACGAETARPIFFSNSDRISPARCAAIAELDARGSIVNDVVTIDSSTILVLYGSERELVTYDDKFRALSTVSFERDGPRGVGAAVSATKDGNVLYVADEERMLIKLFDLAGQDRGTIRLDFVPRRVRSAGGTIVVSPLVMAGHPTSLLYSLRDGRPRSLALPIARYEDAGINAFANMGSIAGFPDGRIVVMHEMIVPFGYSISPSDSASSTNRFAVPLPESQRSRIGKLPEPPLTDKNIGDMVAVALTATPDPVTGHTYFLTRTGRKVGGSWEKMIVELDTAMGFVRAGVVLNRRPLHMTYLPNRRALLVVDDADRWLECTL